MAVLWYIFLMKSIGIHHYGYVFLESSQGNANHICKPSIDSVPETHLALSEDLVNKWKKFRRVVTQGSWVLLKEKVIWMYISGYLALNLIASCVICISKTKRKSLLNMLSKILWSEKRLHFPRWMVGVSGGIFSVILYLIKPSKFNSNIFSRINSLQLQTGFRRK